MDAKDPAAVGKAFALVTSTIDTATDHDDPHAATRRAAAYLAGPLRDSTLSALSSLRPPPGWQSLVAARGYRDAEVIESRMDGAPADTPLEAHRAYIVTITDVGISTPATRTSYWLDLRRTAPTQPWTIAQMRTT